VLLTAVVAVADNDVIGRDNQLPWHLPADLAHFKRITLGKPVLMGRRTFESIGRPLPGRRNVVLTRSADWPRPAGVDVLPSVGAALEALAAEPSVMVIGGAAIFRELLARLDLVELTRVHCSPPGDVRMPPLPSSDWREVARSDRPADEQNEYALSFITLERIRD
jgi:dihydrofolate reductase